jgi:Zn-dependent protease with chaperone function
LNTGLPLALELPAALAVGALSQFLAVAVALAPARWGQPGEHWTECARRGWSARLVIGKGPLLVLAPALIVAAVPGGDEGVPGSMAMVCVALFFGALCGNLPGLRRLFGRKMTLANLLAEFVVNFLVRYAVYTVFLIMLGLLIAHPTGAAAAVIMGLGFLGATVLTLGAIVPPARWIEILAAPPPRLEQIVAEASVRAGFAPPPRAYVLRWQWANAVALPFNRAVAFTPAILDRLSDEELIAVCRHEIAHLQESPAQKLTRLSGLLLLFPIFTSPFLVRAFGPAGILVAMGVMFAGGRFLRGFSQRMEKRADAAGHAEDPRVLASALEKLYEYNLVPAVMRGKRQTHPHLYDRLLAAGVTPAYPRPEAPSLLAARIGMLLQIGLVVGAFGFTPGGQSALLAIGEWAEGLGQSRHPRHELRAD